MRALYFDGAGKLEWREDPEPAIIDHADALVRPVAVSPCDLDQRIIHVPVPGADRPFPIGHEGVGEVVEVGRSVTTLAPGDLVAVPYHLSCGACDRCTSELPLFCRLTAAGAIAMFGIPVGAEYGGMFSDLIRVPHAGHSLLRLPPGVSPVDAVSVGDNLADAWRSVVPHLRRAPDAEVLIMGSGSIGLFSVDVAIASGARTVHYVDPDPARRAVAERLGASAGTPDSFDPAAREYHITLNHGAQDVSALRNAILATAPGGYCESSAFHFNDIALPLLAMHLKCITFRSALSNARCYMPEVLRLLASGKLHPDLVITGVHPFETAAEAMPAAGFKPVFTRSPILAG